MPSIENPSIQQRAAGWAAFSLGVLFQDLRLYAQWVPSPAVTCQGPLLRGFAAGAEVVQAA